MRGAGRRRIRRSRSPSLWSTTTAPPICSSPRRRSATTSASISATASACTSAASSRRARRACRQDGRGRSRALRWRRSSRRWRRPAPSRSPMRDPAILPKAIKNPAEIAGHRAAQARDGAALVALPPLAVGRGAEGRARRAQGGGQAAALPPRDRGDLRDLSFDTISGAGPNGAIVHYRVDRGDQPADRDGHASTWSIPAANIRTAPPTSPAPCRSARRPRR